ncbi:MAG: hypothetical protein D6798_19885 [Deltaproteobacteria bacterium]|nr:MAG: hypothetical protein D6798_19885 [Deltaproteobacteria bacterium]
MATQVRTLAFEVHALLSDLDTARFRAELADACRRHVAHIEARMVPLTSGELNGTVAASLDELRQVIAAYAPPAELPRDRIDAEWTRFRTRLQPAYEHLVEVLRREAVHVPARRPTNYARSIFHFASAAAAIAVIWFLLTPTSMLLIGAALAALAWTLEAARRISPRINAVLMAILGGVAHPHEHYRVNSATWYCTALLGLGLTGSPLLATIGLAVLGVADPVAALVGRRWGTWKLVHGRSLQGTLAFLVAGTVVVAALVRAARTDLAPFATLALAATAAGFGAIAELFSLRVDDNLSIPIAAAAGAAVAARLLSIAL